MNALAILRSENKAGMNSCKEGCPSINVLHAQGFMFGQTVLEKGPIR